MMKNNNAKILSVIVLISSMVFIMILSFLLENEREKSFTKIRLGGNQLCSKKSYLKYLHLDSADEYVKLTPKIIRDRFQKHPYVESVNIDQSEDVLNISVREKIIDAILIYSDRQLLITNEEQLIPFLPNTNELNCPVISNPKLKDDLKILSSCRKQKDIIAALKIISTIQNSNPEFLSSVSEIDLREGKDILIFLDGKDYPVIIGRNNLVKKSFLLSNSWIYLNSSELNGIVNHIDLRYKDMLVFGFKDTLNEEEGTKI